MRKTSTKEIERAPTASAIPNKLYISSHSEKIISGGRVIKDHLAEDLKCQARGF